MTDHKNIHEAILAVMREVGYVQKERAKDMRYTIKTEKAAISALRPAMVEHGIVMYPVLVTDIHHSSFVAGKHDNHWNRIVATHVYRFCHVTSDTHVDVAVLGDAADMGDKAGNKSMTTSKKYALLETFLLETGDDPDLTKSPEQVKKAVKNQKQPGIKSASFRHRAYWKKAAEAGINNDPEWVKKFALPSDTPPEKAAEIADALRADLVARGLWKEKE